MLDPDLSNQCIEFLNSLPKKRAGQVADAIFRLCEDPYHGAAKKLKGYDTYYRYRVGDYRIVYEVDHANEILQIVLVESRNDDEIYKLLER